jgi:phosphatidylglycerol lysyltransferase
LPLPVIEVSHLSGSVAGILLILVARGLQRRVETAYYATVALLLGGIVFSLLKGLDFEEAIVLAIMLAAFLPCRQHFYRRGALVTERLSVHWFVAITLVVACTLWIMMFAYKHVEYNNELWWQFAFDGHAPRSLRAMASVTLLLLAVTAARLLRSQPRLPDAPTADELEAVSKVVARSPRTASHLALLGDKRFLFNEDRTAFLMYGVEGRSWVSMGDPVGDERQSRELAWNFCELCDVGARWPVFYQVNENRIPVYVDIGLTLVKLGEEARVPLANFTLEGSSHKSLRRTNRQLSEQGCTFEIIEPPLHDQAVVSLKEISDAWLAEKHIAEKGFSLGFFQADYIRRCPVALVRDGGRLVAMANIWRGADKEELSVDLMRYLPDAPQGVMEFLFTQLMLQGRHEGYRWFNLGMAPLSGIEAQALAPLWNRIASLAYRHGEHFYNFQGLRQYKQKFHPEWTAKYLASPGGMALPIILTNVASLISGGMAKVITK